ncbi:hypothetical protein DQ04_16051000 [Trypanosoma grayi]|uniref:hypothetical protein n=1 Tax=Trypanosoma grayi TaxID=71804 RepID=UPI0004F44CAA|nr:hypothetical protein DQ04_16051000 [Trypanosoma grayi]KEG06080.1 hypothetical protein DQ04_16051000 [Trypanosoma grayi]
MMATVCRVVCVLAAALCCTALCVAAAAEDTFAGPLTGGAAAEKSVASAAGIKARITLKEAEVQKAMGTLEAAKKMEEATNDAVVPLEKAKEAAKMAEQIVEAIKVNVIAVSKHGASVFSVASKVSKAASALKKPSSSKIVATKVTKEQKIADAKEATKKLPELLTSVAQTVSDAQSLLQKVKDANAKRDEALQHVGWVEANSTSEEAHIVIMVSDAKAAVVAASTAVDASLANAEWGYSVALILQNAANETDVAAKEVMAVINDNTVEPTEAENTKLKTAWESVTKIPNRVTPAMRASKDVVKDDREEAANKIKNALSSIDAKLEAAAAALQSIVSSRLTAESALQNARQELQQLQEEAHQLEQREKKEPKKEDEELSPSKQFESATTTTSDPSLNKDVADGEKLLAQHADSTSSKVARLGAPLLLLLLACVALW